MRNYRHRCASGFYILKQMVWNVCHTWYSRPPLTISPKTTPDIRPDSEILVICPPQERRYQSFVPLKKGDTSHFSPSRKEILVSCPPQERRYESFVPLKKGDTSQLSPSRKEILVICPPQERRYQSFVPLKKGDTSHLSPSRKEILVICPPQERRYQSFVPLKKGHPSYQDTFSLKKWWPCKMGATVCIKCT